MILFEFIFVTIDLFWTAWEQRKTLDRTKQALREHARKVLNLDDTRDQSLWAKWQRGEITFEQRPPIKPTLRQRIANIPHAIRFRINRARMNRKRRRLSQLLKHFNNPTLRYTAPKVYRYHSKTLRGRCNMFFHLGSPR